jgi:hypothetical protein
MIDKYFARIKGLQLIRVSTDPWAVKKLCPDIRFVVCTWAQCIGNEKHQVKYLSGQNVFADKTYQRTKCVSRQNVPAEKCISSNLLANTNQKNYSSEMLDYPDLQMLGSIKHENQDVLHVEDFKLNCL